jgi:hypothetical protein
LPITFDIISFNDLPNKLVHDTVSSAMMTFEIAYLSIDSKKGAYILQRIANGAKVGAMLAIKD